MGILYGSEFWKTSKGIEELNSLALLGLSNKDIADYIGITPMTLSRWAKSDKKIFTALNRARKENANEVVASLFRRAMGHDTIEEVDDFVEVDGELVLKRKRKIKKPIVPDTQAIIFYLKNVDPQNWREKQEDENDNASLIANALIELVNKNERSKSKKK